MITTLYFIKDKTKAKILEIRSGRRARSRLEALGLTYGEIIEKVSSLEGGPILIKVRESVIALGRGEALKVYVEVSE